MKRYLGLSVLLPVMALMLGCGAKVTHFMIPEEEFYSQIKVIAFPSVEFNYEEVKDQSLINTVTQEFEELILQKFSESKKFQIIPPSKCKAIRKQCMEDLNVTGFFSPTTGKKDEALFEKFTKNFISELKCDGILYVSIDTVDAKVKRSKASWDGVTQSIETAGGHIKDAGLTKIFSLGSKEYVGLEGECGALSLVATIRDRQALSLWEGRGGIHVLVMSKAGGMERLPPEEVIVKPKHNQRAVDIAFESLLK